MSTRTLLAAAALAALLPLAAQADSGASALASTGVAGNGPGGSSSYSWNVWNPNGYYGHGQSSTSTGSATGTATTAYAQSHDNATDYAGVHDATSTASADLSTVTVAATVTNSGNAAGGGGAAGQPAAKIWDTLTFTSAGASADTTSTFGVTFTVHSDLSITPGNGNVPNGSYLDTVLALSKDARSNFYVNDAGELTVANDVYPSAWDGTWTSSGTANDKTFVFTGDISFQGPTFTTSFSESMQLYCYNGAQCSSSASFALGLPSYMTVTSESGAFPTGVPSPSAVPEPQNALLLLAGLGALGMAARRRASATRA
jgi:hypothetical protein